MPRRQKIRDTSKQYETWQVPKLYLHLYKETRITYGLAAAVGSIWRRTAFEYGAGGLCLHYSQRKSRYKVGSSGPTTIPCSACLYPGGPDVEKNDFFEHITAGAALKGERGRHMPHLLGEKKSCFGIPERGPDSHYRMDERQYRPPNIFPYFYPAPNRTKQRGFFGIAAAGRKPGDRLCHCRPRDPGIHRPSRPFDITGSTGAPRWGSLFGSAENRGGAVGVGSLAAAVRLRVYESGA